MNLTNAFGTITALVGILVTVLTQVFGCAAASDAIIGTCTSTMFSPQIMIWIGGAFGVLVLIGKSLRPGGFLHSWFGQTAVVVDKPGVGTVTPEQVKTP